MSAAASVANPWVQRAPRRRRPAAQGRWEGRQPVTAASAASSRSPRTARRTEIAQALLVTPKTVETRRTSTRASSAAPPPPPGWQSDAGHVYWPNFYSGTIGRANLDGTGVDQSFISGASFPTGVAVDAGHVYWSNPLSDTIGRANLDGTGVDPSFITGASSPNGLAVDGG